MANPGYVRSSDGADGDNGSTWALANATLAGAMADQSAGDRVWASDKHAESSASAQTITAPGTLASPTQILCGDDAAEPPTALAATATVATTGTNAINIAGSLFCYGIAFTCGSGSSAAVMTVNSAAGALQEYQDCDFILGTTGGSSRLDIGPNATASGGRTVWRGCDVKMGATTHRIRIQYTDFEWAGGRVLSGSAAASPLFDNGSGGRACRIAISGVDFANMGSASNLFDGASTRPVHAVLRNCKLPASWSGALVSAAPTIGCRFEMHNCDNADTMYVEWVDDYAGQIRDSTGIYLTAGASDGTTHKAWKMDTSKNNGANAEYPLISLDSSELAVWIDSTGSKTVTVEVLVDSAAAWENDDLALDVQYQGDGTYPLASFADSLPADVLATPAALAAGAGTGSWTGTGGLTNPRSHKLTATVTVAEKGWLLAKVRMFRASDVAYIDPRPVIS